MYLPSRHAERRPEVLHALIDRHPLGALVRLGAGGPDADHIPFELVPPAAGQDGPALLRAHVARANPVWRQDGAPVLVLFQGASSYISPTRYDLQALGGREVPTWDYAVVHARGRLRTIEDGAWILAHMRRTTRRHEGDDGWTVEDAPRDYIDKLLAATVGIEIAIERLEGKFKRSVE